MVVLEINKETFQMFEDWNEVTVDKARGLFKLANQAPEELLYIYNEQTKGDDADEDQINIRVTALLDRTEELHTFFRSVLVFMSDVSKDVADKVVSEDIVNIYNAYLFKFVFGVLHFPLNKMEELESFELMGVTYKAPTSKKVMGLVRPFHSEKAGVFCDASDVDKNSRAGEFGRYGMAELVTAILFREDGADYTEVEAMKVADECFDNILTCDIYHAALKHLSATNVVLKQLFPNIYQSTGDMISRQASESSGLADFGWMNSIMSIAEMGVLNDSRMTPLESVRQAPLYDFMTVLSNMRANNDFQSIYRENIQKKK